MRSIKEKDKRVSPSITGLRCPPGGFSHLLLLWAGGLAFSTFFRDLTSAEMGKGAPRYICASKHIINRVFWQITDLCDVALLQRFDS